MHQRDTTSTPTDAAADDAAAKRQPTHQIGEVAESVGLSLRTIRHYEEVGLAPPSGRSTGGFRLYTDADVERLRLVKSLRPLEFSLDEIGDLLSVVDTLADAPADDEAAALRIRLEEFAAMAEQRCERLRSRLAAAEQIAPFLRARLDP